MNQVQSLWNIYLQEKNHTICYPRSIYQSPFFDSKTMTLDDALTATLTLGYYYDKLILRKFCTRLVYSPNEVNFLLKFKKHLEVFYNFLNGISTKVIIYEDIIGTNKK